MSIVLNNFDNLGLEAIAGGTVGSQVKAHRESAGYSIEDLAVTCGLANTEDCSHRRWQRCRSGQVEKNCRSPAGLRGRAAGHRSLRQLPLPAVLTAGLRPDA